MLRGVPAILLIASLAGVAARAEQPPLPTGNVELPELIRKVEPVWPSGIPRKGSRSVMLQAMIEKDGTVGEIKVIATDDNRVSESAIRAVKQWKYKPARQNGEPIAIYFTIIVRFSTASGEPAVRQPKLVDRVEPVYPEDLLARQVDGDVELELQVNSKGQVQAVRVLGSTHESFSAAAVLAVQKWRFKPATDLGNPVAAQVTERIEFRWQDVGKKRGRR
jgi:protein TonB